MIRRLITLLLLATVCTFASTAQTRRPAQRKPATQQQSKKKASTPQKPTKAQMQQQRAEQQRRIREDERKRKQLEAEVKKRMDHVLVLSNEIGQQQLRIDSIRKDLARLNDEIALLDSQLVVLQAELEEHRNRYKQTMRYMHRNRSVQNKLMFVFGADNFHQMYRRMRFMNEYADYQRAQGEAVMQKQEEVGAKQRELADRRKKQNALLAQNQREQQRLEQQQTQQRQMVDNLQKQKKTLEAVIAQRRRQEAELERQIRQRIAEEEARAKAAAEAEARRQAEAARKQSNSQGNSQGATGTATPGKKKGGGAGAPATGTGRRSAPAPTPTPPARGFKMPKADRELAANFAENKGKLPLPIVGSYRVVRKFGPNAVEGMSGVVLESKGVELMGQPGAQVRCIFNGVVTGVYQPTPSAPYVVMVRHGNYISAYSNLHRVSVKPGQNVTTRQALGNCGTDGLLVFQLRDFRKALNPMQWLNR